MTTVIRVVIEERNPGGPPARPFRACAFSGCTEPKFRIAEPWSLCRRHANRVEEAAVQEAVEPMKAPA